MFEQLDEPADKKPTDYSGVLIALALLPVVLVSIYLGKENLGRTVSLCLGAMMLAIRIRWDLRRRWWFWTTVILLFLAHMPMLPWIHWSSGWTPGIAMLPFVVADCLIFVGAIWVVERLAMSGKAEDETL